MPVSTFVQPNFPAQTAAAYKAALDAAIAVLATVGADYACHAKAAPDMQVLVDAGQLFLANSTLVSNAQQTSITIVAPVGNPRIDRIVINDQTGIRAIITGTPAASPTAPAITAGTRPIAQILLQTSSTVIANSMITDERVVVTFDVSTFMRTLLVAIDNAAARATLGSTATGDAVFVAASAAAARTTLGAAALAGLSTQDFAANALTVAGLITATAGQIKFPATQNPSADANTLDDYEEGTWTPGLGGTATYTFREGRYTKIGRLVFIAGEIQVNTIGTGSTSNVSGLPFVSSNNRAGISVGLNILLATAVVSIGLEVLAGSTDLAFHARTAANAGASTVAVWGSSTNISFAGCYSV